MTARQQYDSLDSKQRRELLLKIGETPEPQGSPKSGHVGSAENRP